MDLFSEAPSDLGAQAFTHPSWVPDRARSYERLAFLGDAVLSLSISDALVPRFVDRSAGSLTKIRAQTVSRHACESVARDIGVPERIRLAAPAGEAETADRLADNRSTLAEMLEAMIGVCYVTAGYDIVQPAIVEAFESRIEYVLTHTIDFKSELQEFAARESNGAVRYRVVDEAGPSHDKVFDVAALVGEAELGFGRGKSKKEAEQEAAMHALDRLKTS